MSEALLWGASAGLIILLHVAVFAAGAIIASDDLEADEKRLMVRGFAGLIVITWGLLITVGLALAHLP
jgi:hypothetical protein